MIKHVYLLNLKDKSMTDEVVAKLKSLKDKIPHMLDMEVGVDFKGDSNSAQIIEVCTFANMEDFKAFGVHPYHCEIREFMSGISSGMKIDYEL